MTVRVDRLESDVVPVSEPSAFPAAGPPPGDWQELARMRAIGARLARDRRRTHAEGHDD
jgi:hypothetical protein